MKTLAAKNLTTELPRTQISPESALAVVTEDYEGVDVVFTKETMAFLVDGNFDILTHGRFKEVKHSFLIRNPEKSLKSLYHCSLRPETTVQDCASTGGSGFKEIIIGAVHVCSREH